VIIIDTSAWIAFFRGEGPAAERVDTAIADDEAAWCGPVEAELRRGFVSPRERARVLELLSACRWLSQPDALWQDAGDLGYALRRRGLTVRTFDLLIVTYALSHGAAVLTLDSDFHAMKKKGVSVELVSP
jgi:predicted nucleic acid-binding protein